jgi:dihydrolipoamide dehydrogenase
MHDAERAGGLVGVHPSRQAEAAMTVFDVVVLGGGTAGPTAALAARYEGATVCLVERKERIGGMCSFYGCVPSKALI